MKTNDLYRILIQSVMAVMFAAGATACSDEGVDSPNATGGREISFEVREASAWKSPQARSESAQTGGRSIKLTDGHSELYLTPSVRPGIDLDSAQGSRGDMKDASTMDDFGVYASHNDGGTGTLTPGYMFNVEVTRSNNWTPRQEYLWPGTGVLHINAYSPYCDAAGSEGLTALPAQSSECPLSVSFVTPADVADQFDLMYAKAVDASASPVELSFNHALTAVRFATGSEMAPCTVKSIVLRGVADSGVLSLESGEWTGATGSASYSVAPETVLTAQAGSAYAAADVALADETFLLLPQTLGKDATVELTIELNGAESTFTASLDGQTWQAGTTVTYRLAVNPSKPGLILEVLDANGNPLTDLAYPYTGGTTKYTVRSFYGEGADTAGMTPVEWEAQFLDADGNFTADVPEFFSSVTQQGSGESNCVLATELPDPNFLEMSENTRTLRNATDINTSSGMARYNLSNSTGGAAVENTANCYIINAPGKYSLPLVYGNGVKDGATNESAYISTLEATAANQKKALLHFVNHRGAEITDPYIYNNAGCTPASAGLMWEDRMKLVQHVALSADGHSIEFDVPASSIRQGNAVLTVRDADSTVLWSWHVWITDFTPANGTMQLSHGTVDDGTSDIYTRSLGTIYGGDRAEFKAESMTMRIVQKNVPEGMTPLSADVVISREGVTLSTGNSYSFYQFGRKDPMITGLDQYYNSEHQAISTSNIPKQVLGTDATQNVADGICKPATFFTAPDGTPAYYLNLWDIDRLRRNIRDMQPENVKTIYDPCPVGAKVPMGSMYFTLMNISASDFSFDSSDNTAKFEVDGGTLEFLAMGYRQTSGGEIGNKGMSFCWTALATSVNMGRYFSVGPNVHNLTGSSVLHGFAVRPEAE